MVIFNGLGLLGKVNPCLCQRYYTISGLNYIIHRFTAGNGVFYDKTALTCYWVLNRK
jgi:hypothetical protein